MSVELIDKEVSTEDLHPQYVEEKEVQESSSKEKEKKETMDFEKLEAVLSILVENKVMSIRNYGKKVKEKNLLFKKFQNKSNEGFYAQEESQKCKNRANSSSTTASSCKCGCHQYGRKSIIPCQSSESCQHKVLPIYAAPSVESSHQLNLICPHQSFESYETSLYYKSSNNICCNSKSEQDQRFDRKKLSVQKCLPKKLSTEEWLNSTSRQTSTETATTSSGYISPTFGTVNRKHRTSLCELEVNPTEVSTEPAHNAESETIIDISKIQAQKILVEVDESKPVGKTLSQSEAFNEISINELENIKVNSEHSKNIEVKCDVSCHVLLPQCASTTCLPSCRYPLLEDQGCFNAAPSYRHLHPSGGHYVSCCNSPSHSFRRFQYDDNYLTLAMNLEDLEFEQEEERRKRRKRKKKRRKERQARARGLMADELKNVKKNAKILDPEDLPKRARWTIVATACLLLLMSMLLVGVTLRMAPIIDEMVRKENEEMLHSLSRQGTIKEASSLNTSKASLLDNSTNRF